MNKSSSTFHKILLALTICILLVGPSSADQETETKEMLGQIEDLQEMIEFNHPRDYSTVRYSDGELMDVPAFAVKMLRISVRRG